MGRDKGPRIWERCYLIGKALLECEDEPQDLKYVDMTPEQKISKLLHKAYWEATGGTAFDRDEFMNTISLPANGCPNPFKK